MANSVSEIIAKLESLDARPVRRGSGFQAHCPAHDDGTRSLSINAGTERHVLLYCHAGCTFDEITAVLSGERPPVQRTNDKRRRRKGQGGAGQVVARYEYRDETGRILYSKARLAPKSFRFEGPDGTPGLPDGVRRVPYRLDEIVDAPAGQLRFIVEGEKDANLLAERGQLATTADAGAGKWPAEFAEYFAGRHVVIIPDNDPAGRDHAQDVAAKLAGAAESIKIVELPGLPEKGDVSDWLDAGHNIGELLALVYDTPHWQKPRPEETQTKSRLATDEELAALWWAKEVGDLEERPPVLDNLLRRRLALVEKSDNPLLREALTAIQEKKAPANPLIRHIINQAASWAGPGHVRKLIALAKNAPESNQAEEPPRRLDLTPGIGEWPKKPPHRGHASSAGTVVTIRERETAVSKLITPNWRSTEDRPGCPACKYERAHRQARQVLVELYRQDGQLWMVEIPTEEDFRRFADRLRKRRERGTDAVYRAYPQPGGACVVVHNQEQEGGRLLTNHRGEIFDTLHDVANATPDGRLISSSAGWGGPWQGTRGDGRVKQAAKEGRDISPCVQLWTNSTIEETARALGVDVHLDTSAVVALAAEHSYGRLVAAGIQLRERRTNRSGLSAFLEFLGVDVTDLTHRPNPAKPLGEMRDIPAVTTPAARPQPLNSSLFAPSGTGSGAYL